MAAGHKAFAKTLKRFDFDKHRSHRWLLLKRQRREAILAEAGLLDLLRWDETPVHLGNIVRVEERYDWGQVVFQSDIPHFDSEHACSVYAGFEFLIRQCGHFPSFISIADLYACGKNADNHLPVYGARFDPQALKPAHIHQMLQLHSIERRKDLLIRQVCEVSDSELFERYFQQAEKTAKIPENQNKAPGTDAGSLDDVIIRHT